MPLIPMRVLLDHAAENDYGVGAFNVNNMEQIQSIMTAATETESPVIVQASRGARSYSNDNYLRHLMLAAAEESSRPRQRERRRRRPVLRRATSGARSRTVRRSRRFRPPRRLSRRPARRRRGFGPRAERASRSSTPAAVPARLG